MAKSHATCEKALSIFNQDRKTIKCFFLKGIFLAHRDSFRNAGFIFVSSSDNAHLEILDATTSSLQYQKKGRTGNWCLQLFDQKCNLVCEQEVRDVGKAAGTILPSYH